MQYSIAATGLSWFTLKQYTLLALQLLRDISDRDPDSTQRSAHPALAKGTAIVSQLTKNRDVTVAESESEY